MVKGLLLVVMLGVLLLLLQVVRASFSCSCGRHQSR